MTTAPGGDGTGYGSHQPALRALARFMPIRSVIEFGAGVFSTHLFLDPEAFPDLTSLVTFEHQKKWIDEVEVADDRHRIVTAGPDILLSASEGMKADFVFLDNAPESARFKMVPRALEMAPVFGIHDCKAEKLRGLEGGGCKYIAEFGMPALTVIASNTVDVSGLAEMPA